MIIKIALRKLGADLRALAFSIRDYFRGEHALVRGAVEAAEEINLANQDIVDLQEELRQAQRDAVEIAKREAEALEGSIKSADEAQGNELKRNAKEVEAVKTLAEKDIKKLVEQMRSIRKACQSEVRRVEKRHGRVGEQYLQARQTAESSLNEAKRMQRVFAGEAVTESEDAQDGSQE